MQASTHVKSRGGGAEGLITIVWIDTKKQSPEKLGEESRRKAEITALLLPRRSKGEKEVSTKGQKGEDRVRQEIPPQKGIARGGGVWRDSFYRRCGFTKGLPGGGKEKRRNKCRRRKIFDGIT